MTQPAPPGPPPGDPGTTQTVVEVFDPNTHPHPLRAEDVQALLSKEIG